ncbi:MAG: rRNA maturation RNase YbeY [Clostridia bacterium]|nr:rRNA maturation RNase YbeY [Clostridia bacterium]
MHTIEFYNEVLEDFLEEELLLTFVKNCLEAVNPSFPVQLSITVTDNETIREVNKEQRQIDKPTDVLSFPMLFFQAPEVLEHPLTEWDYDPETNKVVLGDILISHEKIREQAQEYGHTFEKELCYLVLHGILHLFGYDHMNDDDKKVMRQREKEILAVTAR